MKPGQKLRVALESESPLQLPGVINAFAALLARDNGFQALYLSGAGVANASYGIPDLGMTTLENVVEDVRRITSATDLPLLVDADTGWESTHGVAETIAALEQAGAAGCHLEDQVELKRCGHRPNKQLVSTEDMGRRVKSAVEARADESFIIMARTDAVAPEGIDAAITRCLAYVDAGADMIFCEALATLDDYRSFTKALDVPVLANITEFGKTPLFSVDELRDAGIAIALYPLSAFRAMSQAAFEVYQTIRKQGSQEASLDRMQTRDQLYQHLGYHQYETALDDLQKNENPPS